MVTDVTDTLDVNKNDLNLRSGLSSGPSSGERLTGLLQQTGILLSAACALYDLL